MLLFVNSVSFASDTFVLVGSENRVSADGILPRAKTIIDVSIVEHVAITATLVVSPGYAEAYIGPTWKPAPAFAFGVAGGMESAGAPWRVAAYTSVSHKGLWLLGVVEYGGTGLWYKALTSYSVGPVGVGALLQRFDGVGPRLGVSHAGLEFWVAPLYDIESATPNGLVGINWTP